jgi:hypothetical protein
LIWRGSISRGWLNDVESKEQFCVEVSNRFAALEDLDTEVEINSARETWSLTLREEHRLRLRVFENRVLRGIFGP